MAVEGEVPPLQGDLVLGFHQDVRLGEIQQVNSSGWMSTICSPLRPMGWAHSAVTPCRVLRRAYWGRHRRLQSHSSEEELKMRVCSASCPSSSCLPLHTITVLRPAPETSWESQEEFRVAREEVIEDGARWPPLPPPRR